MVALETERSKSAALDKKQRKFDQSLAEEKAVSERYVQMIMLLCTLRLFLHSRDMLNYTAC